MLTFCEMLNASPTPSTNGILITLFTSAAAASCRYEIAPTMAVSIRPRPTCDSSAKMMGSDSFQVRLASVKTGFLIGMKVEGCE